MLKAVIFDMDDTLLDWSKRTQDWVEYDRARLGQVFNYINPIHAIGTLDNFRDLVPKFFRDAWLDAQRGLRAPHLGTILGKVVQHLGVPESLIDTEALMKAYDWQPVGGVEAFPDVVEILPLLVSHGVKIGIVTNAFQPMWMRDRELEAYGLLSHFADCRISAADVGYLKPHPAIFQAALKCIGAAVDEAVFVGDNPEADVAGAQSVGMRAVLRIAAKTPPLISGLIVPDGAINTLHELLPLLDEWYPTWRQQKPDAEDKAKQAELEQITHDQDDPTKPSKPKQDNLTNDVKPS